jgi:ferric-dicitrate binding protein FerR (iron transport regulator)
VEVPAIRTERVRAAVRTSWQRQMKRRAARRRAAIAALLFGAAAALVIAMTRQPPAVRPATPGFAVARVERVQGGPLPIESGDVVRTGDWIETPADSRVALRFDDTSVRLDTASRVRALSSHEIELTAGAVYIDTGGEDGRFIVRTPRGTARDVGTQFEVRLIDSALRLRVRTGIVELQDGARSISGRAGTEIVLSATSAASRPIPASGSEWEWASRLAPALSMEGRSLDAFLQEVAREQGWSIEYADARLARDAENIVLHGSIRGLLPADAVGIAIGASGLRHRFENGKLAVFAAQSDDPDRRP